MQLMIIMVKALKTYSYHQLILKPNEVFKGQWLYITEHWGDINKVNKPIFVTFDDGMKNNMNAFRILQKLKDDTFKPTATEYMIVDNVDAEALFLHLK